MISNLTDKDSIRSLSPIVIHDNYPKNSLLLSCCGGSRIRKNTKQLSRTIEDTNHDVKKGFFKRIQFFKGLKIKKVLLLIILSVAQKRLSSVRKQQLATAPAIVSNGHLIVETDRLSDDNDDDERNSNIILPSATEFTEYSHPPIRNSQSIPYLNRTDSTCNLNNAIDSYSFTDIEVASLVSEQKSKNPSATPKSIVSHHFSLATTNLSAYSTQSLLRKLRDKAQILDEYYKDISNKPKNQQSSSLCSSSNSLLERSDKISRSFHRLHQSNESIKISQRRKYRNFYDNVSSDSSRFNLYVDEDNILKELIRFNNDIDLILSRLEMEGENLQQQQQTTDHPLLDENPIQQTTITDITPQINNQ
jgi:hypothetical protein